jgi:hypothetical protein
MPKSVKVEGLDPIPNALDLDPIPAPRPYTPSRLDPPPTYPSNQLDPSPESPNE